MAIKFDKLKAGDVLYDVGRALAVTVEILEIDADGAGAWVSWNSGDKEYWTRREIELLRRTPKIEGW